MNVNRLEHGTSGVQASSSRELSTTEVSRTSPVLRPSSKIRDRHWERLAIVYIRQSSPYQVLENRESRERQYALAKLAEQFGWPADRVVIIDEDQGVSGKSAANRGGFQRLLAEVSMNHVGLILALELNRLSRSSKDWHHPATESGQSGTIISSRSIRADFVPWGVRPPRSGGPGGRDLKAGR